MLLGKDVDKIISYAKSKGLKASIVSNAYWAINYDKAYRTLKRLKGKGLTSANFSTGADHNHYVPWRMFVMLPSHLPVWALPPI